MGEVREYETRPDVEKKKSAMWLTGAKVDKVDYLLAMGEVLSKILK